ncbi:MAG: hypothetical protein HeimC2_36540 [Candidatus Heimdallarchaeota archaeon LC_2]|nr:MAG: hypothetical protein HeimC2_36540 [Candidatus Heimdallarchaeota archaeon LC_2]
MKKRIAKSKLKIIGVPNNFLGEIKLTLMIAILTTIPMYLFFISVEDERFINDYRQILSAAFGISESRLEILPQAEELLIDHPIVELLFFQMFIIVLLGSFYIFVAIYKFIFRRKFLYTSAVTSKILKSIIFRLMMFRAFLSKDIKPYSFFTEVEIQTRSNKNLFFRSVWITLVIFAASFQFAGLIYIRSGSFPRFFQIGSSVIDTSVVFMILSGSFWMSFLIGVDILERYDIRILDLGRSKLMNVGKELGKISKNGFNFLTLSFFIVAVQDFKGEDWIQTMVFLDLFLLISLWMLLDYESHLYDLGSYIRHGLDKRTISGAERHVVNKEKKRFGQRKLEEAEALMLKSEKRVGLAMDIGFFKASLESFLATWIVLITATIVVYTVSLLLGSITLNALLAIQTISALTTMCVLWFSQGLITKSDNVIRRELLWFPMFIIGDVIVTYVYFEYDLESLTFNIYTIGAFLVLWFLLIIRNIYPKIPGFEFWGKIKTVFFVIILFGIMLSTLFYQILILEYFGFNV